MNWRNVWLLLTASSALYFLSDHAADNDLWVHVRIGITILASGAVPRLDTWSYTAVGLPWVDHEWLTHALFGALYGAAGSPGLVLLKLLVAAATALLLWTAVARRTDSPHIRGAVMVATLAVLARGYAIRPQIVTFLALVGLWCWLDRAAAKPASDRLLRFGLPLLLALWANAHGAFVLGIGVAGLCALCWLPTDRRRAVEIGGATAAGIALSLVANPYGPSLALYLWQELGAPHPITEWQPLSLEWAQATFLLLAGAFALAVLFFRNWRTHGWQPLLALLLLVMAIQQQRHTPLFAVVAAPLIAGGADTAVRRWNLAERWRLSATAQRTLRIAILALASLQLVLTGTRLVADRFSVVFAARDYPVGAVRFLASAGVAGNLAVPLDWGGYTLWHLGPGIKVSLDGRFATVYPPDIVEANFAFFSGREGWRRLIDELPTEMVLAALPAPPLDGLPGWRRAYSDLDAVVFVRRGTPADATLAMAQMPATPLAAFEWFP